MPPSLRLDFILGIGGVCCRFQQVLGCARQEDDLPVLFRQRQQESIQIFLQRHNPRRVSLGILRLYLKDPFLQINVLLLQPRYFGVTQARKFANQNHRQDAFIRCGD